MFIPLQFFPKLIWSAKKNFFIWSAKKTFGCHSPMLNPVLLHRLYTRCPVQALQMYTAVQLVLLHKLYGSCHSSRASAQIAPKLGSVPRWKQHLGTMQQYLNTNYKKRRFLLMWPAGATKWRHQQLCRTVQTAALRRYWSRVPCGNGKCGLGSASYRLVMEPSQHLLVQGKSF